MQNLLTTFFAASSVAIFVFTTIAGLVFSNRVAGPLYRLREHCEKVAHGETCDDVSFRKGDYFDDLADAYNRQMAYLRSKLGNTSTNKKAS